MRHAQLSNALHAVSKMAARCRSRPLEIWRQESNFWPCIQVALNIQRKWAIVIQFVNCISSDLWLNCEYLFEPLQVNANGNSRLKIGFTSQQPCSYWIFPSAAPSFDVIREMIEAGMSYEEWLMALNQNFHKITIFWNCLADFNHIQGIKVGSIHTWVLLEMMRRVRGISRPLVLVPAALYSTKKISNIGCL